MPAKKSEGSKAKKKNNTVKKEKKNEDVLSEILNIKSESKEVPVNEDAIEKNNEIEELNVEQLEKKFNKKLDDINSNKLKLENFTKSYTKLKKDIELAIKSSREKDKNIRIPPRFNKPTLLSNKISDFLNKPHGTEMSRIDVTKLVLEYIWKHELINENNEIKCDQALCHLLNVDLELDVVTIFNLRRYLKHNYPDDYLK